MWGDIAVAFLLAFITAYVITPYTIRFAKKKCLSAIIPPKDVICLPCMGQWLCQPVDRTLSGR